MATFRNDVKQIIEEEKQDLAKEFGVPVAHLTLNNKVVKKHKLKKKRVKCYQVARKKSKKRK